MYSVLDTRSITTVLTFFIYFNPVAIIIISLLHWRTKYLLSRPNRRGASLATAS